MSYYLKVQEYLLTHSLNDLIKEHGVYHRIHGHKMSLNYDQIESKENDPIAKECRGLILGFEYDIVDPNEVFGPTEVLAFPFRRFFNYGQDCADNINFKNSVFYEKLDGTLTILYWDQYVNKWCIATRSVPEANLPIDGFGEYTFSSLFQKAIEDTTSMSFQDWLQTESLNKNYTYMFELCTPLNQIVVRYENYRVWLLGMRDKTTGTEFPIETNKLKFVPSCISYNLNNVNQMIEFVESCNPLEHEGIVARDTQFRRVKVKNPAYVAYNRIRDSVANSPRALMQVVLQEKLDDLHGVLPQNLYDMAVDYQTKLKVLFNAMQEQYDDCMKTVVSMGVMSDKVKQKQFALEVQRRNIWLAPMMTIYSGKAENIRDFVKKQKTIDGEYKKSLLDYLIKHCE